MDVYWRGPIRTEAPRFRDVVGVEGEGIGKGCPPLQPTKSLGERRKFPSGVWVVAPADNGFWCIWDLNSATNNLIFFDIFETRISSHSHSQ